MLTARDVQELLHVDRSTVYRMADAGRLPAIKVGKQWRFPAEQFHQWFQAQVRQTAVSAKRIPAHNLAAPPRELDELLSWEWLRIIQTAFADLLGVMIVVTDIQGRPINQATNPCGLFTAVSQQPGAMSKFVQSWSGLATAVNLTPAFRVSHLGLLCARSMIAVGTELKGMVIAGCVAPDDWPPSPDKINAIAGEFDVSPDLIRQHVRQAYTLDNAQKSQVLATLPQIATLIAHIVDERKQLIDRLEAIAGLTQLPSL